jgi:Flp pilus assembly protein TadG
MTLAHQGQRLGRQRRGAAIVEFAVVVPVFFILVFGLVDIGRGFMVRALLANAARAGCRTGSLPSKANTDIQATINTTLNGQGIYGTSTAITVNGNSVDAATAQTGDQVSVTLSVPVGNISWLPGTYYLRGNLSSTFTLLRE